MPHREDMPELRGTRIRVLRSSGPPLISLHDASAYVGGYRSTPPRDHASKLSDIGTYRH
jgi:hypothetical protein